MPIPAVLAGLSLWSIIRWILQAVARWLIGRMVWILFLYTAAYFAEQIRAFVALMFGWFNNFVVAILDQVLDYIWIVISFFQELMTDTLTEIEEFTNSKLEAIDVDFIISLPEMAKKIDDFVHFIGDSLVAGLSAYIDAYLNPIYEELQQTSDEIINIRDSITSIADAMELEINGIVFVIEQAKTGLQEQLNAAWAEGFDNALSGIRATWGKIQDVWLGVATLLNTGADEIADHSIKDLYVGKVITQEDIDAQRNSVFTFTHEKLILLFPDFGALPNVDLSTPYPPQLDFFLLDSVIAKAETLRAQIEGLRQMIINRFGPLLDYLNNTEIKLKGIRDAIEQWIVTVWLVRVKTELEAWVRDFTIVAWAVAFDQWRTEVAQEFIKKKGEIRDAATERKENARAYMNNKKQEIADYQEKLVSEIDREHLERMYKESIESIFDHGAEIDQEIEQINIAEFVKDAGEVDYILERLKLREHNSGPNVMQPEEWTLDDLYRISVNYHTRPERIALALIIAEKDLSYSAKEFYDKLWERKE